MVTKGLKNTIDAITADPSVEIFPDPPLRKMTDRYPLSTHSPLPYVLAYAGKNQAASSSFYSLHIWNLMDSGDDEFNPGNNEPDVGIAMCKSLWRAKREAPEGSPVQVELQRRYEYLWDGVGRMIHDASDNWWDGPSRPSLSSSASRLALNETVGDGNATVM